MPEVAAFINWLIETAAHCAGCYDCAMGLAAAIDEADKA